MSVQRESRAEAYDAVVVGSGMGGLSAAATLALAGKKVLVVERHDRPGGYAHGFQRKKYRFDAAVHMTSGCEPVGFGEGAMIDHLLRLLGVRDRCTFHRLDPFYTALFPGFRLDAPLGTQEFIEAHARQFPEDERGLRQLIGLCTRLNREVKQLPSDVSSYDALRLPEQFPLHAQYRDATLGHVLDQHLTNPRLKTVFATLWGYLGLPPSRVAFLRWAPMLLSYLHTGAYYCQGGFQNLVNAVVEGFEKQGGELLLRTPVRRITVRDGRVAGVVLENGQRIQAPVVVANADATQTFEELVGVEHLPAEFVRHFRQLKPSLSGIVSYMATTLDMSRVGGAAHEMFAYDSWDHDAVYRDLLAGRPAMIAITIPTLVDPSLAPAGEHLVTAMTLIPYELATSWREQKEHYQNALLQRLETVFPGFKDHLVLLEGASPRTMERYTLNLIGALYGWEQSPAQAGANRLSRRTPIPGLYLAGHWTQPGGGLMSVVVSGVQTAQVTLGYPSVPAFLAALEGVATSG